jgi:hypothetical protein
MAKKAQVEKATKAMFEVLKRGKVHNLSIQCQLDLFDKIIKPILLYGQPHKVSISHSQHIIHTFINDSR